jgi:hypothetical protein
VVKITGEQIQFDDDDEDVEVELDRRGGGVRWNQMMLSDILERRRLARQGVGTSSSGLGESRMSGGDGGVQDEITATVWFDDLLYSSRMMCKFLDSIVEHYPMYVWIAVITTI